MRLFASFLLLLLAASSLLSLNAAGQPEAVLPRATTPSYLLLHQMVGDIRIYPETVRDNLEWIETNREFIDGVFFNLNEVSSSVMLNSPLPYDDIIAQIAPVIDLNSTTLTHNFALVFNRQCADPFDDWSVCIENWRKLARAINVAGLTGIAFDSEEYFERWTDYPDNSAYPDRSLEEYQDQTRLRGKQVMQAIVSEYPEISVIVLKGPYISEPQFPEQIGSAWLGNNAEHNELKGAFFVGFLEGLGPQAELIDGGQRYELRTQEEFALFDQWRRYILPSDAIDSTFIPPSLRGSWDKQINFAFAVYNRPYKGQEMDAKIIVPTTIHALEYADEYVWLYFEQADLLSPNGIDEEWVIALRFVKALHLTDLAKQMSP